MYEYRTVINSVESVPNQIDAEKRLGKLYADGWQPVWQALRGGVAMVTLVKATEERPLVRNQMLCPEEWNPEEESNEDN